MKQSTWRHEAEEGEVTIQESSFTDKTLRHGHEPPIDEVYDKDSTLEDNMHQALNVLLLPFACEI